MAVTVVEKMAKNKFGSLKKLFEESGIKPSTAYPALCGVRLSWPKFRRQVAAALGVSEDELFEKSGWPKKEADADGAAALQSCRSCANFRAI